MFSGRGYFITRKGRTARRFPQREPSATEPAIVLPLTFSGTGAFAVNDP